MGNFLQIIPQPQKCAAMTHQMSKLKKFINKKTTTTKQGLNKFTFNYIQVKETVCFVTKNESRKKNQPVKKKNPSIVENQPVYQPLYSKYHKKLPNIQKK